MISGLACLTSSCFLDTHYRCATELAEIGKKQSHLLGYHGCPLSLEGISKVCVCVWKAEEGLRFLRTGATSGYEMPDMSTRDQTQVLWRSS